MTKAFELARDVGEKIGLRFTSTPKQAFGRVAMLFELQLFADCEGFLLQNAPLRQEILNMSLVFKAKVPRAVLKPLRTLLPQH